MKRPIKPVELTVKSFITAKNKIKGGVDAARTFNVDRCGPSNNMACTFDKCFSQGPGCSDYQVC